MLLLLSFVFFVLGGICVIIPFWNLKRKIIKLIEKNRSFSETSLSVKKGNTISRLTHYMERTQNRIQNQSNQLFFLRETVKKMVFGIKEAVIILDEKGDLIFHNSQSSEIFSFSVEEKSLTDRPYAKSFGSSKPLSLGEHALALENTPRRSITEITRSPDVMNIFKQCLQKKNVIVKECTLEKKNQYLKSSFQVTALPVFHTDLKINNVILLFNDQTDIKESQQAHIDFVSNVSHELKTPLTSIQGYVEMLIHDFSQKKLDQFEIFLQILLRNCKRMSNLVDDLLSLSNLTAQTYLEKKRLSTKKITNQVMEMIVPQDHKLHYFFSAEHVLANPIWVEMVLYNLIDNACRHTPRGCDVYIRWENVKDRVLLKVMDTGEGIPEKYQQRIFERFFRVDPARSREKGGTGVGLALVKQSMEKHGGFVRAISRSAGGMEFICEFPDT